MPSYKRPGVYIEEVQTPSFAFSSPNLSTAAFVGPIRRGPTQTLNSNLTGLPTVVNSWSEYVQHFGSFEDTTLYLPFSVFNFFNNGGRRAWVVRAIGSGATKASRNFADIGATPQSTISVTAQNEGVWGNSIYIDFVPRPDLSATPQLGRFDLIVRFGGTSDANIVERWLDVSMNNGDARYVVNILNNPVAGSQYVTIVDLNSTNVAPADTPAAVTAQPLSGGTNGSTVLDTDTANAINALNTVNEPMNLNLPGNSSTTAIGSALNYADPALGGRGDIFVIIDPTPGLTASQAISFLQSLTPTSYGAMYFPWLRASDPSTPAANAVRTMPPGGFVAGQYASSDASRGVFKTPAGIGNRVVGVAGLENKLANSDLDALNQANVNAIRDLPGAGICIMGGRTLKNTPQTDRYISVRRSLIYIKRALLDLTQFAVFEPNDQILWLSLTNVCTSFLLQFWQSGGLRGGKSEEAFYVKCDSDNNTPQVINSGEVHVEIGVALQQPAEFVVIRIGQWDGGQSVIEIP